MRAPRRYLRGLPLSPIFAEMIVVEMFPGSRILRRNEIGQTFMLWLAPDRWDRPGKETDSS